VIRYCAVWLCLICAVLLISVCWKLHSSQHSVNCLRKLQRSMNRSVFLWLHSYHVYIMHFSTYLHSDATVRCRWVRVMIAMMVVSSSAVRRWTMHCWGMELRITSFVQRSVACVRIFRTVQMLWANMNRCVLHSLIPGSVNCWRLVHSDSLYLPFVTLK